MRRVDGARGLRAWVTNKVENAGGDAIEGLREIRGRWEAELGRLQAAERKLVRLQEQVICMPARCFLAMVLFLCGCFFGSSEIWL